MKSRPFKDKGLLLAALLVPILVIGLVDWLSGPRVSLALFYALPIVLAGWLLGAWAALSASVAAGLGIYIGDLSQQTDVLNLTHIWNTTVRLLFLVAVGQFSARVRRDRDTLRQLLARETTARIETVEQLRHRDRLAMVGQISSGIAHEVGTPLNVIAGRARLIKDADTTLTEARQHATAIVEQSERVTLIIRQLLDFSRRRGPQPDQVNLVDLASRVLSLLRPLATKRQVELTLQPSEEAVAVSVDATQLEQALSNLVLNAIQAITEAGMVTVQLDVVRRSAPAGGPQREYVALVIKDTGTGIATEHLSQIFEPFFTTQRAGEGTGLGLSITNEIIRDHGGWIEVKSEPWKGSQFTVFLPREPPVAAVTPP